METVEQSMRSGATIMIRKNFSRTATAFAVAMATGLVVKTPAFAQDGLLEEIVVTAQKRPEKLSDVPISVSVLGTEQIDSAFATNIEGLQAMVPSVSFRKGNTTRNSALTVRGIGTISFSIAAEPSVSTVVDNVVLGRSGQAFTDLYDLERIEVLRGPQGTLFGKNASAGVVNITTKRPTDKAERSIEAELYDDNEFRFKASISGPLGDHARGSLVVVKRQFDGYIDNVFNNQKSNGYDREGLRGMLELDVDEDLSLLLIAERYEADDECCADLELVPSGRNPESSAAPDSDSEAGNPDLDQRRIDHDLTTVTLDETTALSFQISKAIGEAELTAITAFRAWDNTEIREGDFTSIAGDSLMPVFGVPFQLHDVGPQEWRQLSQEIRFASPIGRRVEFQVGGFYWNIESERNFTREASCQNNAAIGDHDNDPDTPDTFDFSAGQLNAALMHYVDTNLEGAAKEAALADLEQYAADNNITCNANDIVSATAYMSTEFKNWAIFGDGKVNLGDRWRLLFGLRYTDDEVSYKHTRRSNDQYGRRGVGVRPATENTDFSGDTSKTNLSAKVGAQWDISDNSMLYATWSQGYKGPGFNVYYNFKSNGDDSAPISEETSTALELGYKLTTDNFILNAAIFQMDISDFQANNFDCSDGTCITRLTNAGDVTTRGLELDLTWRPMKNFTLFGGLAYVEAEIDEFNCPTDAVNCSTRSGLEVPYAPELKYSLVADWRIPTERFDIVLNGAINYTDEQITDLPGNNGTQNPAAALPDYTLVHASIGLSFNDDRYRITLVGRNLTDESYLTTYSGDGFRYQVPRDAQRYFGVAFKANF